MAIFPNMPNADGLALQVPPATEITIDWEEHSHSPFSPNHRDQEIIVPTAKIEIDWEEYSSLEHHAQQAMEPDAPEGEIEIDWEEHNPLQIIPQPAVVRGPLVKFSSDVKVILAPSRADIRETSCELWWKRQDYLLFQQSSYKEVKLYSVFHGLPFRQARRKLYQSDLESDQDFGFMSYMTSSSSSSSGSRGSTDEEGDDDEYSYPFAASGMPSAGGEEDEDEDYDAASDPMLLYVPLAAPEALRCEEHNRHDYYNKYHSTLSRVFWLSAGGLLTVGSVMSYLTPLIGYYVLTLLQVTYLGEMV